MVPLGGVTNAVAKQHTVPACQASPGCATALDTARLLHLRNFVHLHVPQVFFFDTFGRMVSLGVRKLSVSIFLHFHHCQLLSLSSDLILHFVFLLNSE